jgi:hypothetical protein
MLETMMQHPETRGWAYPILPTSNIHIEQRLALPPKVARIDFIFFKFYVLYLKTLRIE